MSEPNNSSDLDNLLQPTLQDKTLAANLDRKKPWALNHQIWVAFFGGVLAITVIAYINGKRLGLEPPKQRGIILTGVASFTLVLAYTFALVYIPALDFASRDTLSLRYASRILAVLAYFLLASLQKPAMRLYRFHHDDFASLWQAGLLAVFGLGILQGFIIAIFYGIVRGSP